MNKIIDYFLCVSDSLGAVEEQVFKRIQKGWQPFGSPGAQGDPDDPIYFQAVVRYKLEQ